MPSSLPHLCLSPLTLLPLADSCRRRLNKSTRRALINGRAPQSAIQQTFIAAVQRSQNAPLVQPLAQQPVAATSATTSHQASVAHPPSLTQDTAFVQQPAEQHVATISQQTSASPDYIIPDCPGSKGTPSNATPPRHSSDDGTSPHIGSPHLPFEDHRPFGFEATSPKATPPLHPSDDGMLHIGSPRLPLDPPEDGILHISSSPGVPIVQQEKRQGPPERWMTSTGPFAFSEAFDLMFHTLHNTPDLRTIPILGITLEEKDLVSIPWPRWYTDAVMDVIGRNGVRGAPFPDTTYYQDAVAITAHIAVFGSRDLPGRQRNGQKLDEWCTSLRESKIQRPDNRWPYGRMKPACLSIVFSWTPFNSHWIAVQITMGGTITICSLEGDSIRQYAQLVLPRTHVSSPSTL